MLRGGKMDITILELEETKARLKATKEREIALIRENVTRDIQPKFAEIEQMKAEELNKLAVSYNANKNFATEQYNTQLVALQENFETDKRNVVELAEQRKMDLFNSTFNSRVDKITNECDSTIFDIDNLIKKRTQKE